MENLTLQQFLKLATPDDCRIFHSGNDQWEVRCKAGAYAPGVGLVDLLAVLANKGICCSVIEWDGVSRQAPTLAVLDVAAERQRQMDVEGWTTAHDDAHGAGEIALAAGCYALYAGECSGIFRDEWTESNLKTPLFWPWAESWWKPTDKRRDLVKAAALLLAEIERLDRAAHASN